MSFFSSGLFWFLEGILLCLFVIGFKIWMEDRQIPMRWWKWLLLLAWIVWFGFTIAFVGTSLGENELDAAGKGGILFGLIAVVTGVGLWRVLRVGSKSASSQQSDAEA